ncbi:MAG: hypothetical protein ACRDRG_01360 [Pseudonocardiaceae bacterium]
MNGRNRLRRAASVVTARSARSASSTFSLSRMALASAALVGAVAAG